MSQKFPWLKVNIKGRTMRVSRTSTWKMKAQVHTPLERYFLVYYSVCKVKLRAPLPPTLRFTQKKEPPPINFKI